MDRGNPSLFQRSRAQRPTHESIAVIKALESIQVRPHSMETIPSPSPRKLDPRKFIWLVRSLRDLGWLPVLCSIRKTTGLHKLHDSTTANSDIHGLLANSCRIVLNNICFYIS